MLRACWRTLRPGGRIAGYVIHTAPGLSESQYRRAVALGPSHVASRRGPAELLEAARFSEIERVDVTDTFLETCTAFLRARERYADELRSWEGDDEFEQVQARNQRLVEGITAGLLRRSRVVGRRSDGRTV